MLIIIFARVISVEKAFSETAETQYLPVEWSNFNIFSLYPIVLLILKGVYEINFYSKAHGLGVIHRE